MDQRAAVVSPHGRSKMRSANPTVKCPGCGNLVGPADGICPSCSHSLEKLQHRLQWCNVFLAGVVGAGASGVLMVLGSHGALHGWFGWSVIGLGVGGIVAAFSGIVGVLAGWPCVFGRTGLRGRSGKTDPTP